MFKHIFETMEGVSIYPIFSLMVFFLFFVGLGLYVFLLPKKRREYMENLPLED
jgi:cytochrome c oxidase cbb3-type subunit 4